jgi:hypothetical protein
MIVETIEIDCRPDDIFGYATDFAHFPDRRGGIVSAPPLDTIPRQGRTEGRSHPPDMAPQARHHRRNHRIRLRRSSTVRGSGGPVVATAYGSIDELDGADRSRVTISLDVEGPGALPKLLVFLVRRKPQAAAEEHAAAQAPARTSRRLSPFTQAAQRRVTRELEPSRV